MYLPDLICGMVPQGELPGEKMADPDYRKSNMRDRFADCISCSWICGSRNDMHGTGIEDSTEG